MGKTAPPNSSDADSWAMPASPSVCLLPLLFATLSTVDALLHDATTLRGLVAAAALGTTAGMLLSAGLAGMQWLLARCGTALQITVWTGIGLALALWAMERLAVFARINTAHHRLAVSALGASLILGATVALVGVGLQPRRRHPRGWASVAPARIRVGVGSVALGTSVLCFWIDRTALLITYPVAVLMLRSIGLLSLLVASVAWMTAERATLVGRWMARVPRWYWIAPFVLALSGLGLVDPRVAATLQARPYPALALQTCRWFMDLDRDGYSALLADGDCDDMASSVHPGARELPQNEIDEDCRLGDSVATVSPISADEIAVPRNPSPFSVVLITVDTVSAEHTSLYGYERPTTPHLARWAAERAVIFENAYTAGSSTAIALSANFRGVYPRRLRWTRTARTSNWRYPTAEHGEPELAPGEKVTNWYRFPQFEARPALPWWLKRRGMRTLATTPLHMALPDTGVVGAFDEVVALHEKGSTTPDDRGATQQALEWLAHADSSSRFFLWIHYLGPHTPTTRSPEVAWFGPSVADGFDHEIATFDHHVEPLLTELARRQDRGEKIAVALTADHGEELSQLRFHGHVISEPVARVPMLLSVPGTKPRRLKAPVSTLDLFPTILSLTKTPPPDGLDGKDLMPMVNGSGTQGNGRVVMSEAWVVDATDRVVSNKLTLTDGVFRLTRDFITRTDEVLDVKDERTGRRGRNLLGEVDVRHLELALDEYLQQTGVDPFPATNQVLTTPMALHE